MVMQLSPMHAEASSMVSDPHAALSVLCARDAIRFERRELLRATLELGEVVGLELTAQVTARELARELDLHHKTVGRRMRELMQLGLSWLHIDSSTLGYRVIIDLSGEPPFLCPHHSEVGVAREPHGSRAVVEQESRGSRTGASREPHGSHTVTGTNSATRPPAIPTSPTPTPPTPPLRACEGAATQEPPAEATAPVESREARRTALRSLTRLLLGLLSRTDVDADQAYRAASSLLSHLDGDLERAEACARWTVRRLERRGVAWREAGLYLAALSDAQDVARWEIEGEGIEELLELPVTAPASPTPEAGGVSPALSAHLARLRAAAEQGGAR